MSSQESIALLTDSGTNVPQDLLEQYGIYCAYLMVNYSDAQYRECVEISPQEVQARFDEEIPHTSTPLPQDVAAIVEQAIADGHDHLLCVLTSSGLTSTYSVFESILATHPEVTAQLIDTKNIGPGGGMSVIRAAELIKEGMPWDQLVEQMQRVVDHTRVYFLVDTLENLYKGGRINKAVYSLGSILNLKPIITCAADGSYVVADKARGRMKALKKEINLACRDISDAARYRIAFSCSAAPDRDEVLARIRSTFPTAERVVDFGEVSPALAVHTGVGMLGIITQVL